MDKPVTVSIVSHGHAPLARALLAQLDAQCHAHIAKVVVTVNLPEPGAWGELAPLRFAVELVFNAAPLGFGQNHNQAFRHCTSPWFLVLNPDIEINTDVIGALLASARPDVGVLAPSVWEPGQACATPERGIITPWEVFGGRIWGRTAPPSPVWFPGMFMLFRASAYAALNGFDERFHMYCEDFDICARLRLAGWALQRVGACQVLHPARRDSHVQAQFLRWHVRSLLRLWLSPVFWRYWRHWRHSRP